MSTAAIVWEGAEDLRPDLAPVDDLTPHPNNPRIGEVEEIAASLTRFGQVRPVLIDADSVIVAGNHTYLAARSLGWTHVAVTRNEFATQEEARAYLLADNRLGDLGAYERAELVALLNDLEASGRWEGTGWQPDDLDNLRALDDLANAPLPAAPAAAPSAPAAVDREVVLLLSDDQFGPFSSGLRVLRERYGLEGVTETILRALREEALHLNQGDGEA